ncbi:MAG: glycosyltransferase [Gluconacetobacter diazotrophicus]|nr:glycosyltransferase [Gluconacetobacter diazotrophicus]
MSEPLPVAVFRHNLFRVSETYVLDQARRLQRYRPCFLGRLRHASPPPGPDGVPDALTLRDDAGLSWPAIGAQMLTRNPAPYLRLLRARPRPALVHAHFGVDGVYALPVADRLGVPLVTSFHGFDATLSTAAFFCSPAWANYPLFRRRLSRRGALFLPASDFLRERLLAQGFPPGRTRTHYIGVDTDRIRPRDPGAERPAILHVARLVPVKGTEVLLRAFALLPPALRDRVELRLVGDGPLRSRLERLARELGIAGRTRFLGSLPHDAVLSELRRAAVLVLPSVRTAGGRVEGLGLVLLEAAATGVPTIGSAIGGIPECVRDHETGLLFPPGNAPVLAARLGSLLQDEASRRRFGAAGRAMAEREFDLDRRTRALESLYDEAVRDHRASGRGA